MPGVAAATPACRLMAGPTQRVLAAVAALGDGATVAAIAKATGIDPRAVSKGCCQLRGRSLVSRGETGRYTLAKAGKTFLAAKREVKRGPCGPHTGRRRVARNNLRQRLWRALRAQRKASLPELVQLAARGDERAPLSSARNYMRILVATGYVVELPLRATGTMPTSNGFKRYSLIRDSGPKAPESHPARGEVFDPNTGESHQLDGEDSA